MTISLSTNLAALKAGRQLAESTETRSRTAERLSSGLRINRAADDAAGLAVASSLNADRRVFTKGISNVNDGISLIQIAEGAIRTLSDILIRIQELAEQSANGTYSDTQRKPLDQEADALKGEYDRIVQTTSFNGLRLLDGSVSNVVLQAGYGLNETITLPLPDLSEATATAGGGGGPSGPQEISQIIATNAPPASPIINGDHFFIDSATTQYAVVFRIGVIPPIVDGRTNIVVTLAGGDTADVVATKISAALNTVSGGTEFSAMTAGSTVTVSHVAPGNVTDIQDINVGAPFSVSVLNQGGGGGGGTGSSTTYTLSNIDVSTQSTARNTLTVVDAFMEQIGEATGNTGAVGSRLTSASAALQQRVLEYAQASARISDADLATETASSVRLGILQEVGVAILAQAKQQSTVALDLLRSV